MASFATASDALTAALAVVDARLTNIIRLTPVLLDEV